LAIARMTISSTPGGRAGLTSVGGTGLSLATFRKIWGMLSPAKGGLPVGSA
jgi:hypothetical protein